MPVALGVPLEPGANVSQMASSERRCRGLSSIARSYSEFAVAAASIEAER